MFWRSRPKPQEVEKELPSSELWDLVLDMDWDRVIEKCKTRPIDAEYFDGHWEETPLYLACQQDPPADVIRAIVNACPEAALFKSRANKDLPLHLACKYQATACVLEALLRDFPCSSIQQTKFGVLPLNALWEFRPEGAEVDENFWNKVVIIMSAVDRFRNTVTPSEYQEVSQQGNDKERESSEEKFLVHATVSLGGLSCPIAVLQFILGKYPNQVFERDGSGQLPLHIAVGPTSWSQTTRRKYKPREREFVSMLLDANPTAATETLSTNCDRYPLHIALTNRHTWSGGIDYLLQAAPEVLLIPDPVTKLFPFQLASIPVRDTKVDLDTIFHLLRRRPDVIGFFKVEERKKRKKEPDITYAWEARDIHRETLLAIVAAVFIGNMLGVFFPD